MANTDLKNKYENKCKEFDKMKEEMKKKDRANEDKQNLINCNIS